MITSTQNPRIKNILRLDKAHERREQRLFVAEGLREISLAADAGYTIDSLYICRSLIDPPAVPLIAKIGSFAPVLEVNDGVFEKISYRSRSDGMVALIEPRRLDVRQIQLSPVPLVMVLESVEKPGNLGAILRTADAVRADAVLVCDPQTDLYNPNVIRSSIGCVFTRQIAACSSAEACRWLKESGIEIFAAELTASEWYHQVDFTVPAAIVMGTEADGLTDFWLQNAGRRIKIPMCGRIDSLNVSVSAAVIAFEAMRQRGFKNV